MEQRFDLFVPGSAIAGIPVAISWEFRNLPASDLRPSSMKNGPPGDRS
jgi:hypothetical protein